MAGGQVQRGSPRALLMGPVVEGKREIRQVFRGHIGGIPGPSLQLAGASSFLPGNEAKAAAKSRETDY